VALTPILAFPKFRAFDTAGDPLASGKVYTYQAGTTTPKATYTDSAGASPNANPVVLDANGEATIRLTAGEGYKIVLKSSGDVTQWTMDDVYSDYLTQASLGALLSPRTAAEIAASVTPTNYAYEPIDVTREGAVGDGTTDNTTAIQNILNVARKGYSRVHFPSQNLNGKTVYICGKVQVYEGTHITSDAGVIIRSSVTTSTDHVFEATSTLGTGTALTANATKRDASVAVTSATGLTVGQIVCIRDNTYKYTTNGRNLEFNEIADITSLTVTLKNRLIGTYLTANSAELVPVTTPARNIKFENVCVDIPTSKDGGAFYFSDAYQCEVVNCRSTGQKGQPGVQIWRSAYVNVRGGDYSDGQNQSSAGYGYGINIAQSSHHCVAYEVNFKNIRENAVASNARHCGFVNCTAWSPYDSGFNSHADGSEDCYFVNCRTFYARSKGFVSGFTGSQAADKRISFINCESHYSGSYGFWSGADASRENEDIKFINCRVFHPSDDTSSNYGFLVSRCTRPRLFNCEVDADSEANCRAGVYLEICTDAVIRGGSVRSVTSGWGIIHSNCTGVIIDDLSIANIGSSQGVHTEGTASTKVYIRRNKVDNDVVFTANAGDIHQFNEYDTKKQYNKGANASTTDGATISHGLVSTPTSVRCTSSVSGEFVSVTAVSGSTFTVAIKKHDNTAGTSQTVYWEAEC